MIFICKTCKFQRVKYGCQRSVHLRCNNDSICSYKSERIYLRQDDDSTRKYKKWKQDLEILKKQHVFIYIYIFLIYMNMQYGKKAVLSN